MNEQYLPTADAVVLLYDVRNPQTLKDSKSFMDDVRKFSVEQGIIKILGKSSLLSKGSVSHRDCFSSQLGIKTIWTSRGN